jgi:peptidoglycan/xylan/chitin deacetylase (PgdA/CDA1 family)
MLRRVLLGLRVPMPFLAQLGRLIPEGKRRRAWFGFVSRHAFWRGVRRNMSRARWHQSIYGVPILMYHAFSVFDESDRFVMTRRSFAWQMRLLALLRYRIVRFEDLVVALANGRDLPRRAVAITIDDGYQDNFEIAVGILRKRGYPATVFLVSDRLGGSNDWDDEGAVAGRALLSKAEIDRMRAGGAIRFGAHTRTHLSLPETTEDQVDIEVRGSRKDLERTLETDVLTFAYPYGEYDDRAVETVAAAGFHGACTAYARRARVGDDPLLIPRIEIRGEDSLLRFLRKIWFGGG